MVLQGAMPRRFGKGMGQNRQGLTDQEPRGQMGAVDGRELLPALEFILTPAVLGLFQTLDLFQHRAPDGRFG